MNIDEFFNGIMVTLFVLAVLVCVFGVSFFIVDTAYHHYQENHVSDPPKDTRPAIPNCPKQTWERITEGCDDEGHD